MQGTRATRRRASGFTLVEIIIALAIAAIVLCAATPSFSAMIEKQRLDGVASRLVSDLQFARAQAALRNSNINIGLNGTRAGCYLIYIGARSACMCTDDGRATCTGDGEVLKSVGLGDDTDLRLRSDAAATTYSVLHGTFSPSATISVTAASGRSIHEVISQRGRLRLCSPSTGAPAVSGYPVC